MGAKLPKAGTLAVGQSRDFPGRTLGGVRQPPTQTAMLIIGSGRNPFRAAVAGPSRAGRFSGL